jgi:hypothetical protein
MPSEDEGNGMGAVKPVSTLPWTTPWRVVIIGGSLAPIVESNLVEGLNPPSIAGDEKWIRPGRVSWSWWSDNASPRNIRALRDFVDLAAEMGWEYSLVDANWNLMEDTIPHSSGTRRKRRSAFSSGIIPEDPTTSSPNSPATGCSIQRYARRKWPGSKKRE